MLTHPLADCTVTPHLSLPSVLENLQWPAGSLISFILTNASSWSDCQALILTGTWSLVTSCIFPSKLLSTSTRGLMSQNHWNCGCEVHFTASNFHVFYVLFGLYFRFFLSNLKLLLLVVKNLVNASLRTCLACAPVFVYQSASGQKSQQESEDKSITNSTIYLSIYPSLVFLPLLHPIDPRCATMISI